MASIFKKKPGGTLVGNLLRKVAKQYSHGILGNGANLIPVGAKEVPQAQQDLANAKSESALKGLAGDMMMAVPQVNQAVVSGAWAKYKFYIIGFLAAVGALLLFAFNRKPSAKRW